MDLTSLGWSSFFESSWNALPPEKDWVPGRITAVHRDLSRVITVKAELDGRVSGKFRFQAGDKSIFPTVGDWVAVSLSASEDQLIIHSVLPRVSHFSRKVPGATSEEQILAANIDTVFLVTSLDGDFNPRRIERYLATVYDSGAKPVILLTKPDLCAELSTMKARIEEAALGVPVHILSGLTGEGMGGLQSYLQPGKTAVLLGSSGVGKSTLLNRLLNADLQKTGEVRAADSKGRHTTTHRELFLLPSGAWIIDSPGIRELQLWDAGDGIEEVFADIAALAVDCKFNNCGHETEPGCAVKKAKEEGRIDAERWENYEKLKKEKAYLERRVNQKSQQDYKNRTKSIHQSLKKMPKKGF